MVHHLEIGRLNGSREVCGVVEGKAEAGVLKEIHLKVSVPVGGVGRPYRLIDRGERGRGVEGA